MLCRSARSGANELDATVISFCDLSTEGRLGDRRFAPQIKFSKDSMGATQGTTNRNVRSRSPHPGVPSMTKPAQENQSNFSFSGAESMNRRGSRLRVLLVVFAMLSLIVLN